MSPDPVTAIYDGAVAILVTAVLGTLCRLRPEHPARFFLLSGGSIPTMAVRGAFLSPIIGFAKLQLLAWAIFVRCPVLLVGGAYLLLQWRRRVSLASIMLAIILFAMGVDAFPIEPH